MQIQDDITRKLQTSVRLCQRQQTSAAATVEESSSDDRQIGFAEHQFQSVI